MESCVNPAAAPSDSDDTEHAARQGGTDGRGWGRMLLGWHLVARAQVPCLSDRGYSMSALSTLKM